MTDLDAQVKVTGLLRRWSAGDTGALEAMVPLVYDDLRRIAHQRLGVERPDHTLDTTALVHEAYLRLANQSEVSWRDRAHFYAVASMAMRRILVDYARARATAKRGSGVVTLRLQEDMVVVEDRFDHLLALDEALSALGARDPRLQRVVECRVFAGMSDAETAIALGTSLRTVERLWRKARAYLYDALLTDNAEEGDAHDGADGRRTF